MKDHGYSKQEVELVCNRIEHWLKTVPPDFGDIEVTIKNIAFWCEGDIVDVQPDHLKRFYGIAYTHLDRKKKFGNKDFFIVDGRYIIFNYQYFPSPITSLEMYFNEPRHKMVITTYEGALRVYKYLSGKKPAGFEQYGKEIYY